MFWKMFQTRPTSDLGRKETKAQPSKEKAQLRVKSAVWRGGMEREWWRRRGKEARDGVQPSAISPRWLPISNLCRSFFSRKLSLSTKKPLPRPLSAPNKPESSRFALYGRYISFDCFDDSFFFVKYSCIVRLALLHGFLLFLHMIVLGLIWLVGFGWFGLGMSMKVGLGLVDKAWIEWFSVADVENW